MLKANEEVGSWPLAQFNFKMLIYHLRKETHSLDRNMRHNYHFYHNSTPTFKLKNTILAFYFHMQFPDRLSPPTLSCFALWCFCSNDGSPWNRCIKKKTTPLNTICFNHWNIMSSTKDNFICMSMSWICQEWWQSPNCTSSAMRLLSSFCLFPMQEKSPSLKASFTQKLLWVSAYKWFI